METVQKHANRFINTISLYYQGKIQREIDLAGDYIQSYIYSLLDPFEMQILTTDFPNKSSYVDSSFYSKSFWLYDHEGSHKVVLKRKGAQRYVIAPTHALSRMRSSDHSNLTKQVLLAMEAADAYVEERRAATRKIQELASESETIEEFFEKIPQELKDYYNAVRSTN